MSSGAFHEAIVEFADEHDEPIVLEKREWNVQLSHIDSVTDRVVRTAGVPAFSVDPRGFDAASSAAKRGMAW